MAEERTWDYAVVELVKMVDGDTYDVTLEKEMDFGFRLIERKRWSARFRLLGIDAWEKRAPGGAQATADALEWIDFALEDGDLRGQTFKADDFGRWLIDLYNVETGEHLSDYLLTKHDAVVFKRS